MYVNTIRGDVYAPNVDPASAQLVDESPRKKGTGYFFMQKSSLSPFPVLVLWLPLWYDPGMPRTARANTGGVFCHVLNRGNGGREVFRDEDDYVAFVQLIGLAHKRVGIPVIGWCLMPTHFHFVVLPPADGDLAKWMQWLLTSHVRRHHRRHGTSGHVWQGRFKSFPIQWRPPSAPERAGGMIEGTNPVLSVVRYVERNPLRANLVMRAEDWPWSSLAWWTRGAAPDPFPAEPPVSDLLLRHIARIERPSDWPELVNRPQTEQELSALRCSVRRGRPFGGETWGKRIAKRLGLEATLRPRGRPRKGDRLLFPSKK